VPANETGAEAATARVFEQQRRQGRRVAVKLRCAAGVQTAFRDAFETELPPEAQLPVTLARQRAENELMNSRAGLRRRHRCGRLSIIMIYYYIFCPLSARSRMPKTLFDKIWDSHVVRDLDQNVGVYARVTRPGPVRAGDPLDLL